MSDNPPPPAKGPREQRIDWIWERAWECLQKGELHQFWFAQARADLDQFRAQLPPGDGAAAADLEKAANGDRSHRELFLECLQLKEAERKEFQFLRDFLITDIAKINAFAFQTLTLANGAVVLGVLGYMGREGAGPIPHGLIWVLGLAGSGFLATLLSAHVGILLAQPFVNLLSELSRPGLSEADRMAKAATIPKVSERAKWPSRILSYSAATCLVASLVIGARTLWVTAEQPQAHQAADYQEAE